eukprot:2741501-Pyramimonas_sp.AAC.1
MARQAHVMASSAAAQIASCSDLVSAIEQKSEKQFASISALVEMERAILSSLPGASVAANLSSLVSDMTHLSERHE